MTEMTTEPYILADGVSIDKVSDFSSELRNKLGAQLNQFVLGKRNSRSRSRIIDADAKFLIELFRTPIRIVDAARSYSKFSGLDVEIVIKESFTLLKDLIQCKWLVPVQGELSHAKVAPLCPGDMIVETTIVRCIQALEETEVYEGMHSEYGRVCVKLCRKGARQPILESFSREEWILSHLPKGIGPQLFSSKSCEEGRVLITGWISGKNAAEVALDYRSQGKASSLLALISGIASSYKKLHESGFVHGDVHPRNLIVDETGKIRLIDFGYALHDSLPTALSKPPRNLIEYFQEPELAHAILNKQKRPRANYKSEQYAIGALFYYLLSGKHVFDLSFDRMKQCEEICEGEAPPLANMPGMPTASISNIVFRMLEKDRTKRFASMKDVSEKLHHCSASQGTRSLERLKLPWETLLNLDPGSVPLSPPTASLNFGSAGIAYALHQYAQATNDIRALASSDIWAACALRDMQKPSGLQNKDWDIDPENVAPSSLFHGKLGVVAVQALVSHAFGDMVTEQKAVQAFVHEAQRSNSKIDIVFGKAGVVLACIRLLRAGIYDDKVIQCGQKTFSELQDHCEKSPPIGSPLLGREYLGFAHGWVGVLYALLSWCSYRELEGPEVFLERIKHLITLSRNTSQGTSLPRILINGEPKDYSDRSWCNGSSGFLLLCVKAFQTFKDPSYVTLAREVASHVMTATDDYRSLCCGSAGRSLALLELARVIGDDYYHDAAVNALGIDDSAHLDLPLSFLSLIKGDLGLLYAATALHFKESHIDFPFL